MTTETRKRFDLHRAPLASILQTAAARLETRLAARRARLARRHLEAFSERELEDFGLSPRDIDATVVRSAR